MRAAALLVAAVLTLPGCMESPPPVPASAQPGPAPLRQIEAAMADSAAGWNEGDMDRFLAIYADSPQTTFVGSGGLISGVQAMEARYREAYDWSQPDPAKRGVLTFETQDFRALGRDHSLYIGRYILTYPDGREPATGFTSLIFALERGRWKIVADHSS